MKVTEKKLNDGHIHLEAIASTAEVTAAFESAQHAFAQNMNVYVPQGKSVAQAAEDQLGIRDLDSIVRQQAVEYLVPFALDKQNIVPAYPPRPHQDAPLRRGKTFTFQVDVLPKPAYELTSYEPVTITVPPLTVSEAEVDQNIAQLVDGFTRFVHDDPREVAMNDAVKIALDASKGGEPIKALQMDERMYILGAGFLPADFDKSLVGMNVGETKSFSFSLPTGAPGAFDTVDCTVTVKEMLKKEAPELTDEWVALNVPLYDSVEDMRAGIRADILKERTVQYEDLKMQLAAAELAKRFEGSIADEVYEAMREQVLIDLRIRLNRQGVSFEQFVETQGGEQQFGMMLMLQTRQVLIQGYALDALFRHEKMELTEADLLEACSGFNQQNPAAVKREAERAGRSFALREIAERIKANHWLVEHATVNVSEPGSPADSE